MISDYFIRSASVDWEKVKYLNEYPFCIDSVKDLENINFENDVTFLVGENGSGKSTILEAIAVAMGFNPEGGSKNYNFHNKDTHSSLANYLKIIRGIRHMKDGYFLRSESFYNVQNYIEDLDDLNQSSDFSRHGGDNPHKMSHGEGIFSLFQYGVSGGGLYIFDEPEAALSPEKQMSLLLILSEKVKEKAQFIIATHSPILLSYPGAKIYEFQKTGPIRECRDFSETNVFKMYKLFMENTNYMHKKLGLV